MTARFHESAIGSFKCRKHRKDCYTSEGRADAAMRQILTEIRESRHIRDKDPRRTYFDRRCGFWHLTSQPKKGEREVPYVRFREDGSDVYLFGGVEQAPPDDTHVIVCWGCILDPDETKEWQELNFRTKEEVLDHLAQHELAGHTVPQSAIQAIHADGWIG